MKHSFLAIPLIIALAAIACSKDNSGAPITSAPIIKQTPNTLASEAAINKANIDAAEKADIDAQFITGELVAAEASPATTNTALDELRQRAAQKRAEAKRLADIAVQKAEELRKTREARLAQESVTKTDEDRTSDNDDDHEFIKHLSHLVPFVHCKADFVKNTKFFLVVGYNYGQMVITCRQGIHGEEFTTFAKIVGLEAGLGYKQFIEEGEFKLYGIGIGNKNYFGVSASVKAAYETGSTALTPGEGKQIQLGAGASLFQYVGVIHSKAKVKGHGAAITLELAVWAPSEEGNAEQDQNLRDRGIDVDAIRARQGGVYNYKNSDLQQRPTVSDR